MFLALPADLRALDYVAAFRPAFVQELEGEQAFGEALLEGGAGFGGGERVGGSWVEIRLRGHLLVTHTKKDSADSNLIH